MAQSDLDEALERCASEPIHIPGCIQSCGVLLGLRHSDLSIAYASANTEGTLDAAPEQILGSGIDDALGLDAAALIRRAVTSGLAKSARRVLGRATLNGRPYHVSLSPSDTCWVLELEPASRSADGGDTESYSLPSLMAQLEPASTVPDFAQRLVDLFHGFGVFGRTMVYRFDAEWNGEVIAETFDPGLEPFLGLRFPASDIPPQARALMTAFPVRFVADSGAEQVPILAQDAGLGPLDITHAQLRGTSPIHLEYLKNMQVGATMTLSIMAGDQLWGILSLHHTSPVVPDMAYRDLCAAISPYINLKLASLEQAELLELHELIDGLRDARPEDGAGNLLEEAAVVAREIMSRFQIDGMQIGMDDSVSDSGLSIPQDAARHIHQKARAAPDGIWFSECLKQALPDVDGFGDVSGALCLSPVEGRWICLFRKSRSTDIRWAGAPNKTLDDSSGVVRLEPRGSFSLYRETVKDTSEPWQLHDLKLLRNLGRSLMRANERSPFLAALQRQQALIIDELNHRVKNILALVQAISRQARRFNSDIDSFTEGLEDRLSAMATAHDIATAGSLGTVSMQRIIELEMAPHNPNGTSVVFEGTDLALTQVDAPIFALMVHELVTNSVKYGALSSPDGQILVTFQTPGQTPDDEQHIKWIETGGPAVTPPTRKGFGTTLICEAGPYELGGTAELTYVQSGLVAAFTVPGSVAKPAINRSLLQGRIEKSAQIGKDRIAEIAGPVLVVEDNYMIAAEILGHLEELGAGPGELASTSEQALAALSERSFGLVVLDINLGRGGTSIELAQHLDRIGKPYFFVTGYGDTAALPAALSHGVKVQKPINRQDLSAAVAQVLLSRKATS